MMDTTPTSPPLGPLFQEPEDGHAEDPSLEAVLEELAPRLLRFCLGRSTDASLAEDVAQETLVALVDRWRRRGPPESVEAFAFTIARRRLARAQARGRRLQALDNLETTAELLSAGLDPERGSTAKSELSATLAALGALPIGLRDAILLTAAAELDVASAARVLGISPSALKMRVSRARRSLRTKLAARVRPSATTRMNAHPEAT